MRYGLRNLPVMGPLWFTAGWMPVPWVYCPPGHIPCSVSLCPTPSLTAFTLAKLTVETPQTMSMTDGQRSLRRWRIEKGKRKKRKGQNRKRSRPQGELTELFLCMNWVFPWKPLQSEPYTGKRTFSHWNQVWCRILYAHLLIRAHCTNPVKRL